MSEVLLPTWIIPEEETHEWLDEGSSVFVAAFAPGIAQRQSYGGLRLKMSRRHTVRGEEKAQLLSILQSTRGRFNALRTRVHFSLRGSFPATEGITNNTFESGTTGWSPSNANITLSSSDRILRSARASVAADSTIRAPAITVPSGGTNSYVARVMAILGNGVMDYRLRLGTTAGNNDISASAADITTQGLQTLVGTTSATTVHYSILDGVTGRSIGNSMDFSYTTFSRCALVNGGNQTGNSLTIDGLPSSADGILLPSDFFEINGEVKMVTSPLSSDSGSGGLLQFEPALVRSPLDNDPIIFLNPMGKFLVSSIKVENQFGTQAIVTYDLEHIYE